MIVFNRYVNQEDHTWYDSSNVVYSKCYDTQSTKFKTLKIASQLECFSDMFDDIRLGLMVGLVSSFTVITN